MCISKLVKGTIHNKNGSFELITTSVKNIGNVNSLEIKEENTISAYPTTIKLL